MSIEAMKQALEFLRSGNFVYPTKIATDLEQAIAEAETQEPVGEMQLSAVIEGMVVPVVPVELPVGTKLYTRPQPKRHPLTDEPNKKLTSAARLAAEVLEKHRQMKGEYPMEMLGARAAKELEDAFREIYANEKDEEEAAHGIKENT